MLELNLLLEVSGAKHNVNLEPQSQAIWLLPCGRSDSQSSDKALMLTRRHLNRRHVVAW